MSSVLDGPHRSALCLPRPALGRVGVTFYPGERLDVERCARRLFGRKLGRWEYAGLAGAANNAQVELGTLDGELYLESRDPAAECYRAVQRVCPGDTGPVLVIDALHIFARPMRGKGLGLRMFSRQLTHAGRLGVRRIETTAGRHGDENGYYTWPRFGFDGPLPVEIRRILPQSLRRAQSVLDLFACARGRRWWRAYGTTLDVVFDLADGSRSWKAFARYVREKSLGKGSACGLVPSPRACRDSIDRTAS